MPGHQLLIVEADGLIAFRLVELLTGAGYRIAGSVASGEEALEYLALETSPDLVVMGIRLAGTVDGIAAAKIIRQTSAVPIVFLSTGIRENIASVVNGISHTGYVTKPFSEKDLLAAIGKALEKS